MTNIDTRISNPDQILTVTISKWSEIISSSYSTFFKPVFDTIIFSYYITRSLGWILTASGIGF